MSDIYTRKYKDNSSVIGFSEVPVACVDNETKQVDYYADPIIHRRRVTVMTSSTYYYENEAEFLEDIKDKEILLYRIFLNGKTEESITAKYITIPDA